MKFEDIIKKLEEMRGAGLITKKQADKMAGEVLTRFVKMGVCVVVAQETANKKKKWVFKKMSEKQLQEAAEMWEEFDRKFGIKSGMNM